MTYDDREDTEPYEIMNSEQPIFTCPSCSKNLFDVGVTECATEAHITTVIDWSKHGHLDEHQTQINSAENKWVKCNNCHNGISIDVDQLDAVFSGRSTEEQMKIQCKIIQRPVFRCPQCRVDIFKTGFNEVTYGGTTKSEITLCSDGYDSEPAEVSNFTEQWSECGNCGARIDINAIDLINYYEGECSLEDITGGKTTMSDYEVSFDMKASHCYIVPAKTPGEAKRKAFAKLKQVCKKQSSFNIDVDKI